MHRRGALAEALRAVAHHAPVRVFHWLLVTCFLGAFITAESERWRLLHVTLGYTMGGLVAFRLVWGLIGSRHARFASFVKGPAAVVRYLRSMWGPRPKVGQKFWPCVTQGAPCWWSRLRDCRIRAARCGYPMRWSRATMRRCVSHRRRPT